MSVCGDVVHGVATVGLDGQALLFVVETEDDVGCDEERVGLVVRVDVGLYEDEDAIVGSDFHVVGHAVGVAIDIEAEAVGVKAFDRDSIDEQRLVVGVVYPDFVGGGGRSGEDCVELYCVGRERELCRAVGKELLLLDARGEREEDEEREKYVLDGFDGFDDFVGWNVILRRGRIFRADVWCTLGRSRRSCASCIECMGGSSLSRGSLRPRRLRRGRCRVCRDR